MSKVRFRDVKIGEEFGLKDYFFTKISELTATFSGDLFIIPLDEVVSVGCAECGLRGAHKMSCDKRVLWPKPSLKGYEVSLVQYRALLDTLMVTDPWHDPCFEILEEMANSMAIRLGFLDWIVAYHELKV